MKNIIQVFEHDKLFFDPESDFRESHWKALSRYNEKYKHQFFTLLHNGIKFSHYVGVIQAGNLTIEILPKIDKENLNSSKEKGRWHKILLQMLQECHLLKIKHLDKAKLNLKANSILDLYIEIFLQEVESLLHKGLLKKYRKKSENRVDLKGKIDFTKHISNNLLHKERFFVTHTVYDNQNIYNQILLAALQLIPSIVTTPTHMDKLGRVMLSFPEFKPLKITASTFEHLKFNRKNDHYQEAIGIAKMLLLNYRPDISSGNNNVIAILFDMNSLWEEYVFRQLKSAAKGISVKRQESKEFWQGENMPYPKRVRPDIVVSTDEDTFIIDTKWKLAPELNPDDNDLKQMFVYNLYWGCHSVLLYPAVGYQKTTGTYLKFPQDPFNRNICSMATCNILDEHNTLDKALGAKILSTILHKTQ